MTARTVTPGALQPAQRPTFYFIGVTTGASSIRTVFPAWADALGLDGVEMVGIDVPIHAPVEQYRAVVEFLRGDEMSRGALVTTHKLDLFAAAQDLFDEIDPLATLMHEVSCISKRDGLLRAHAKDPISSGLALEALLPDQYFASRETDVVLFGAGGSAVAIDWFLTRPERAATPRRIFVTNRSRARLDGLRSAHDESGATVPLELLLTSSARTNDDVLRECAPGSLVVNATGLGKDAPGSPISDAARFPVDAIAWDLNYRGDLLFLDQARRHPTVTAVDGWVYFVHGWTQVIAEVFDVEIPERGAAFEELAAIAARSRS